MKRLFICILALVMSAGIFGQIQGEDWKMSPDLTREIAQLGVVNVSAHVVEVDGKVYIVFKKYRGIFLRKELALIAAFMGGFLDSASDGNIKYADVTFYHGTKRLGSVTTAQFIRFYKAHKSGSDERMGEALSDMFDFMLR